MATPDVFGAGSHLQNDLLLVNIEWLQQMLSERKIPQSGYPKHPQYSDDEIKAFLLDSRVPPNNSEACNSWRLVSTETYKVKDEVASPSFMCNEYMLENSVINEDECFSEVLEEVEKCNFIELWHDGFKKYNTCFEAQYLLWYGQQ